MVTLKNSIQHNNLYTKQQPPSNYLQLGAPDTHITQNKSPPFSLAFPLVRICSTKATLNTRLEKLKIHLRCKGSPQQQIQSAINKATNTPNSSALQWCKYNIINTNKITFLHTYNPDSSLFCTSRKDARRLFHKCPRQPSGDRPPSETRTKLNKDPSLNPCHVPQCKTCPFTTSAFFHSTLYGKHFHITKTLSCYSSNIIYLITCSGFDK